MKRWMMLVTLVALMLLMNGCAVEGTTVSTPPKAVGDLVLNMESQPVDLKYIGTVDAKEMVKYSFKVDGKINKIYVKNGDIVRKGSPLAALDTTDLQFQVAAAKATSDTATSAVSKASSALNYATVTYERVDSLYQAGAASKDEYDQALTNRMALESDINQARAQLDAARTDFNYKADLLKSATLYAESDGVIAEKVFNEKERVAPFTTVFIVRSGEQVVKIGVPQQELPKLAIGAKAIVDVDGDKAPGVITSISEIPDEATRTYTAEVTVRDKAFQLGSIAKVSLAAGSQSGIWVPMTSLLSDGESYVYVVEKDRAIRRIVQVVNNRNDKVLVTGLKPGERLVISGMNNLEDGALIRVQK